MEWAKATARKHQDQSQVLVAGVLCLFTLRVFSCLISLQLYIVQLTHFFLMPVIHYKFISGDYGSLTLNTSPFKLFPLLLSYSFTYLIYYWIIYTYTQNSQQIHHLTNSKSNCVNSFLLNKECSMLFLHTIRKKKIEGMNQGNRKTKQEMKSKFLMQRCNAKKLLQRN